MFQSHLLPEFTDIYWNPVSIPVRCLLCHWLPYNPKDNRSISMLNSSQDVLFLKCRICLISRSQADELTDQGDILGPDATFIRVSEQILSDMLNEWHSTRNIQTVPHKILLWWLLTQISLFKNTAWKSVTSQLKNNEPEEYRDRWSSLQHTRLST